MLRAASILLAAIGSITGLGFLLLYLGGYSGVLEHERIALIPLIAGLGAAVFEGRRTRAISVRAAAIAIALLAVWVGYGIFITIHRQSGVSGF